MSYNFNPVTPSSNMFATNTFNTGGPLGSTFATGIGGPSNPQLQLFTCPPLPNITVPEGYTGEEVFVQTFFEGPPTCTCCKNWVEKEPAEIPPEFKKKYTGAAIILYKCKDHTSNTVGGLKVYNIASIDIQSPLIRKQIQPLLDKLGFHYLNDTMVFKAPFRPLFFGFSQILDKFAQLESGCEDKEHMKLLVDCMEGLFSELGPKMKDFQNKGIIDGASLWALFPKGLIVYSRYQGHDRAFEVVRLEDWILHCRSVSFDGSSFGWESTEIMITKFTGTRNIIELEAYPFSFHPERRTLEDRLIMLGAKGLKYQDISFLDYDGQAQSHRVVDNDDDDCSNDDDSEIIRHKVETQHIKATGRLVVDVFRGQYYIPTPKNLMPLIPGGPKNPPLPFPRGRRPTLQEQSVFREVIGENRLWLMLMPPTTVAYHMKEKVWVYVSIDGLSPTSWNDGAFDQLVLPVATKDLVRTFVESHKKTHAFGRDIVAGKGRGLVILLSGPPGTGKTLTVESVSDKVKRPLYHLQAGEMGSNPSSLKSSLQKAFRLCEEWDGILLLDEADALIRDRERDTHASEDLCCVLLATLEYYSGIIFMTTNLVDGLDDAIVSRLDIHLEYSRLDFSTRLQLWKNLLPNPPLSDINGLFTPDHNLTEADFRNVACWMVNGRDIKHAVKNATKWCFIKKDPITLEALETGLRTTAPRSQKEGFVENNTAHGKRKRVD